MAFLRFRLAYIIVAVFRSTALRRVVDGSLDRHRDRHGDTSSSLHPGVNTVRPRPSGSGRSVLTPGPHRLLSSNQAPHLWCVATKRQSDGPLRGRLTGRSTSTPGRGEGSVEVAGCVGRSGALTTCLGTAPGVGKTYAMLRAVRLRPDAGAGAPVHRFGDEVATF